MSGIRGELLDAIRQETGVSLATALTGERAGAKLLVYDDGHRSGTLGDPDLDSAVAEAALEMLPTGVLETRSFQAGDESVEVYIESYLPPRRLIVVGAVHTAIPLVTFASELGYRTTVIDARELFATKERFPHADDLIVAWPDEALSQLPIGPQTDIVMLAHDPKFEDPAMEVALRSRAGYIGAMGSRRTSQERNERLKAAGFTDEQIDRIHGPIGLNIGSRTPEEVAISIIAEIIAVRRGKDPRTSGSALRPAKADQPAE
jgi:xanthine dehydrogenase accessory factor